MANRKDNKTGIDLGRLRHRTRETYWLRGDSAQDNFALKREFESIAKSHNDLVDELGAMMAGKSNSGVAIRTYVSSPSGNTTTKTTTGGTGDTVTDADEKAAIAQGDTAGYLFDKIKAGDGIAIEPTFGPVGQVLVVRLDMDLRQYSFSFTGKEVTVYHPFANYLYDFALDKPLPDGSLGPLTYETYKKSPNRLWLRFAHDEFGIVTLTGRLGAVQVG
ncbi:MAG: hypothetical protein IH600_15115 [Bacteroidetes bacterium]|nr:hypothetical protein [Bacteroidota bacterium]